MKTKKKPDRQLAVIVFSDIVGYTAMMQKDQRKSLEDLERYKACLESEAIRHKGKIIQYYGDGCLMTFQSAFEAVNCCKAMQLEFRQEPLIPVRIGIHLGDVVYQDGNIFGDAVNVASRIESMGIPGTVLFSETVATSMKGHPDLNFQSLGSFDFKNVEEPMEVFALADEGFPVPERAEMKGKLKKKTISKKSNSLPAPWLVKVFGSLLLILLVGWLIIDFFPGLNNDNSNNADLASLPAIQTNEPEKEVLSSLIPVNSGTFTDSRDRQVYKWVQYKNGQKWMAQNLLYEMKDSRCYADEATCPEMGRLYPWQTARKACPPGWRLPSRQEWLDLIKLSGGEKSAFLMLTETGKNGFSAVLGGVFDNYEKFNYRRQNGNYWADTEADRDKAWYINLSRDQSKVYILGEDKKVSFSCRCLEGKEELTISSNPGPSDKLTAKEDPGKQASLSRSTQQTELNNSLDTEVAGELQLETYDAASGRYLPVALLSGQEDVDADLKIARQNSRSLNQQSGKNVFETINTYAPESRYRFKISGSGFAYVLSVRESGQIHCLYPCKEDAENLRLIDADLNIAKRPSPTTSSADPAVDVSISETDNDLLISQILGTKQTSYDMRIVLLSRTQLDIESVMVKLEQTGNYTNYYEKVSRVLGSRTASAEQAELALDDTVFTYRLEQEDPDVLPLVFLIKRI